MPPSTDDFHNHLQKIALLETKIHQLEVNVEVNGLFRTDTTLSWTQNYHQQDHQETRGLCTSSKSISAQPACPWGPHKG